MVGEFSSRSIAYGLKFNEFSFLKKSEQKKLIRLMARISEKSYRRGFQHGKYLQEKGIRTIEPEKFRFEVSLDKAPFTDCCDANGKWVDNKLMSAIDRLFTEYGELQILGF